jgi:transcriptional regulator with XRE-family HTH domain
LGFAGLRTGRIPMDMPDKPKKLYEPNRIEEWRTVRGMRQEDLAEKLGTSAAQIGKLERRERRLTTGWMMRLAEALEVYPTDLLDMAAMAGGPDVEPTSGGPHALALGQRGLRFFRIITDVLSDAGYARGQTILADASQNAVDKVQTGDVVIIEMKRGKNHVPQLALRIYVAPDLLTTNRAGGNVAQKLGKNAILADVVPENHTDGAA